MPVETAVARKQTTLEIATTLMRLFDMAEEAESPEERGAIELEIQRVAGTELATKVDGIAVVDKDCKGRIRDMRGFKKTATARIKALQLRQARIREISRIALNTVGQKRFKGNMHSVSIRPGEKKLSITDASKIPGFYMIHPDPPAPYIDAERLKADLEGGMTIPGAELVPGEDIITIR